MINYYQLGGNKRLCDIVVAGSHDAGITSGGANEQTQNLDIFDQARAGVRVFDLRIAATKTSSSSSAPVHLKAFHADPKLMFNRDKTGKNLGDFNNRQGNVTTTKLPLGGTFGMGLPDMLDQACDFLKYNTTEFLILKFDKCKNWPLIAEICVSKLGSYLYTGTGSLNEKTLDDLKQKVVVLFTQAGLDAVSGQGHTSATGIWGCKSLTKGGSYSSTYDGLQYIGKGGTNPLDGKSDMGKIAANIAKQGKLMRLGARGTDPEVMGMLYWTTTGLKRSIQDRDRTMWGPNKQPSLLAQLWEDGFGEAIEERLPVHMSPTAYATGAVLKAFMPNIVMVDFADIQKGTFIHGLNTTATTMLTDAARKIAAARQSKRGALKGLF